MANKTLPYVEDLIIDIKDKQLIIISKKNSRAIRLASITGISATFDSYNSSVYINVCGNDIGIATGGNKQCGELVRKLDTMLQEEDIL